MHIHFAHTILRIIETTPKYYHAALPEAHNPDLLLLIRIWISCCVTLYMAPKETDDSVIES